MFTGIVSDIGTIGQVTERPGGDRRLRIESGFAADNLTQGCSISCAGCCLTVVDFAARDERSWFDVDVSNETLSVTTLESWVPGTRVNLERALTLGGELGGHLSTGHVDAVAVIIDRRGDASSERFTFAVPEQFAPFIAAKGSVALDGTSLTVNDVSVQTFGVNLIPHTLAVTTWGERRQGDRVNLEIDVLARYVSRLMEFRQ